MENSASEDSDDRSSRGVSLLV